MRLEANGHTAHLELSGDENAPVVVLSHALAANSAQWRSQVAALERDYRVLCYDIRGHGSSDAPDGPHSLAELADDAEALLGELGLEQVHWVGACLGAMIGQALAVRGSPRLASLVLAGSAAALTEETRRLWRRQSELIEGQGLEGLAGTVLDGWFTLAFREDGANPTEEWRQSVLSNSPAGLRACYECVLGLDQLSRLRVIDLPTLVVVGAEDPVSPIPAALAMHERIAGSRLEIVQSAAHLVTVEQASKFNEVLLEFLR